MAQMGTRIKLRIPIAFIAPKVKGSRLSEPVRSKCGHPGEVNPVELPQLCMSDLATSSSQL